MFTEVISDRGNGPPLIYVPGIDGSGQLLQNTAGQLEESFRLIRVRYSLGVSSQHHTYSHLAGSLIETVSLRGIDRMSLLAESFGGAVAVRAALDFPDRIQSLALVNSFPYFGRRFQLALSRASARFTPAWMLKVGRRTIAPFFLFGSRANPEAIATFKGTGKNWSLGEGYRVRLRMIQGLDLREELPNVRQPVLLFAGARDRIVNSVNQARSMDRLLANSHVDIIEDGGHLILPVVDLDWPTRLQPLKAS